MANVIENHSTQNKPILYLRSEFENLRNLLRKTGERPSPDNVHDLRVCLRRIRTALKLVKGSGLEPQRKKLSRSLKCLCQDLSNVRELDVAIEGSRDYGLSPKILKRSRRKELPRVKKILKSNYAQKLPGKTLKFEKSIAGVQHLRRRAFLEKLQKNLLPWFRHPEVTEANHHQLRLALKNVRYALEATGKNVRPLEGLQEFLGKAHDLDLLQRIHGRHLRIERDEKRALRKAGLLLKPALRYSQMQLQ